MKKNIFAAVLSIASLSVSSAFGVDVDSSGSSTQDYSFILDSGNSVSISRSTVTPKVSGNFDDGSVINNGYSPVTNTSIEAKWDYQGMTIGISTSSPYLGTLRYTDGILTNAGAKVTSNETAIVASRGLGNGLKVFGGLRINQFKAKIDEPYAGLPANSTYSIAGGYQYELDTGSNTGFAVGMAYEVPQIMLRASIQYNTEIQHKNAKETETIGANTISSTPDDMVAPSSMIIKLRSALSPRLLAFANYRSSAYKKLKVTGENAGGVGIEGSLHDPESGSDITVGIGLKVNDQINVLLGTARGQSKDTGGLASALAPFKGTNTNFLGASFKVNDNLELNASYSLTTFGDATAGVPPANAAPFTDNKGTRVTIGTKISF